MRRRTAELRRELAERKRAEQELRAAHRRMVDIIEFLPDATFVIDKDKRVVAWNRAVEEMTGVNKEDIIGQGDYAYAVPFYGERRPILIDLIGVEDPEMESRYDMIHRGKNFIYTRTFLPSLYGGKGAFVAGKASALYNRDGDFVGAIESVRDITEIKRAEDELGRYRDHLEEQVAERTAELRTANEQLIREIAERTLAEESLREKEYIIESASIAIATADLDGNMSYGNPVFMKTWGFDDAGQFLGKPFPDYWLVADRLDEIMDALSTEGTWSAEIKARKRDGSVFDVQVSAAMVKDFNGNPLSLMSSSVDITERKRAEEALREAHEHMDATMNALPDLLFEVDREGRIHDFRAPRPELLHVPPEQFMDRTVKELIPPEPADIISRAIDEAWRTGRHKGAVYSIETPAGERWFELSIAAKGDPEKPDTRLIAMARDITDRKEAERELETAITELKQALAEVKKLSGLLPICSNCKKIRNDEGYWEQVEGYIAKHSEADFTHGICPQCVKELYPDFYKDE